MDFSEGAALELGDPVFILGVLGDSFDNAQVIQTRRVGAVLKEPRATYALDQPVTFGYIGGPVVDAPTVEIDIEKDRIKVGVVAALEVGTHRSTVLSVSIVEERRRDHVSRLLDLV